MKFQLSRRLSVLIAIMAAVLATAAAQPQSGNNAPVKPDGNKAYETVKFLASDAFKGRHSGTPEYRKAAEWVAARFKELGLQPAGDKGTWFQEVEIKDFTDFVQPVRLYSRFKTLVGDSDAIPVRRQV